MIFFDMSYVDCSFKTRLKRQIDENGYALKRIKKKIISYIDKIRTISFKIKRKANLVGRIPQSELDKWIRYESLDINNGPCTKNKHGEDLTISGYIDKYGGIKSVIDEKVYTTKAAYMNHVKANGKTIKDW